jgi:hypothetical protein
VDSDLDLALAQRLTTPEGARLLEAARAAWSLPPLTRPAALAGLGSAAEIRAALHQEDLRRRAAEKTPHAERLLFTRAALEQASAWPVARERAARWALGAGERLADLTAGIGLDALAAAEAGLDVLAVERDPVRARLLEANARAGPWAERVRVRCADAAEVEHGAEAVFLDPDRRADGRRTRDADRHAPPREAWDRLIGAARRAIVKAPPAGDPSLPAEVPFEVVSLDGRARERRLLWRGFAGVAPRRALALPGGASVEGRGEPWPEARAPREGDLLLDPDPSVVLAGLVGEACLAHGLAPIHPRIAYLLGPRRGAAPGTWLEVVRVLAPEKAVLNAWLRAEGIGRLEIKTRGVADDAAAWRRRLRPEGPREGLLVVTRGPDDRWIALAARRG